MAARALAAGKRVFYATPVGVFRLTRRGVELSQRHAGDRCAHGHHRADPHAGGAAGGKDRHGVAGDRHGPRVRAPAAAPCRGAPNAARQTPAASKLSR